MPKRRNEQSARDALLEILPHVLGEAYVLESEPDNANSATADVDFLYVPKSGNGKALAVEHTILESFDGELAYGIRSYDLIAEIDRYCSSRLPDDRYYFIAIPETAVSVLSKAELSPFAKRLAEEVVNAAGSLQVDDYIRLPCGSESALLMCRGSLPELNGTLNRLQLIPRDIDERKQPGLWKSVQHGIVKFGYYDREVYSTILAIENRTGPRADFSSLRDRLSPDENALVERMIDYVVEFISNGEEMIVAGVRKEKSVWHDVVPYNLRFSKERGRWLPLE